MDSYYERICAIYGITQEQAEKWTEATKNQQKVQTRSRKGEFYYIPLTPEYVTNMLRIGIEEFTKRRGRKPTSFLEVGSGLGVITHYAQTKLGLAATGIERCLDQVKFARNTFKGRFLWRNALTFKDYDKFDLVYFYQPFSHYKLAGKFCDLLASTVKGFVLPYYGLRYTVFDPQYSDKLIRPWKCFSINSQSDSSYTPYPDNFYDFAPWDGATRSFVYQQV